ncbi:hypothetical protein KI387_035782, partial [Taxus chinensis]
MNASASVIMAHPRALFIITFFLIYSAFISMILVRVQGCPPEQLRALLSFKASLDSWEGEDCCVWSGVVCDKIESGGHVTKLDLSDLGLSSVNHRNIDSSLFRLSHLKYLDLSATKIVGSLPSWLWKFSSQLRSLDILDNNLEGLFASTLDALPNLQIVRLQNNSLEGEIPSNLANLSMISILNIADNRFKGEIPEDLGMLTKL